MEYNLGVPLYLPYSRDISETRVRPWDNLLGKSHALIYCLNQMMATNEEISCPKNDFSFFDFARYNLDLFPLKFSSKTIKGSKASGELSSNIQSDELNDSQKLKE
ncbi:unnamed protein product [Lactuca saligna]|uniref:Uncharacterized protein n=1 Tax=Lactuca saligna TaxID=75948 RepID=A0AA35VE81_LACSI|nr:unnamed protein product [Lactuca saligna]